MLRLLFVPFFLIYLFYVLWPTSICQRIERIVYPVDFVYETVGNFFSDGTPIKKITWHKNFMAQLLSNEDFQGMCTRDPVLMLEENKMLTAFGLLKEPIKIEKQKIVLLDSKEELSRPQNTPEEQKNAVLKDSDVPQETENNENNYSLIKTAVVVAVIAVISFIAVSKDSVMAVFSEIFTFILKNIKKILYNFQPDAIVKPRMRIRRTDITDDA